VGESFAFQGFSATNILTCFVDGENIVQVDYMGTRKVVGKTVAAYSELESTATEYYNKLVELGVIEAQKTPEEMVKEMQKNMNDMAAVIAALTSEIKEMKNSGHERNFAESCQNVSFGESGAGGQ
jgi:flagellar biosynthesis/type III secretory pathway protein FliH